MKINTQIFSTCVVLLVSANLEASESIKEEIAEANLVETKIEAKEIINEAKEKLEGAEEDYEDAKKVANELMKEAKKEYKEAISE